MTLPVTHLPQSLSRGFGGTKSKSMNFFGLTEDSEISDNFLETAVLYPEELKNDDLISFNAFDLFSVHKNANIANIGGAMDDEKKVSLGGGQDGSATVFYQLVFDIKHCIFKAGNDTLLLFSIFDDTTQKFITEEYCLHLSQNNFPKVGSPEDCKVMFRNLPSNILMNDLYIICKIYREGQMEAPNVMNQTSSKKKNGKSKPSNSRHLVRPYASTVIRLKDYMKLLLSSIGEEIKFEPGTAPICCPKEEHMFVALPFDLIQLKKNTHFIAPLSIGIAHGFTLYRGGLSVVEKNYPFYEKLTLVNTMEIDPSIHVDRHLLYVTMNSMHVNQRNKRAACNVCMKMQLRDNNTYQVLPGSIMVGKGKMAVPCNEISSPVYYHNNDPVLNQTYVVLLPTDVTKLEQCHLYFTCWHMPATSKKPDGRGFAFLRLFHEKLRQLTGNNEYELPLYREDRKITNYLDHTNLKMENKTIHIHFRLSSTKVYSDLDVHRFLTWRHQSIDDVIQAVKRVAKQPFDRLLTIFDELMKAVFQIMLEAKDQRLIEQTFATLVALLGEVNKGVNIRFRGRVEDWIEHHFEYEKVWRTIAHEQLRLLQWIASAESVKAEAKEASAQLKQRSCEITRHLLNNMKGVKYVFSIMKRSCVLEIENASTQLLKDKVTNDYNFQVDQLFKSLNRVMGLRQPKSVAGVQSFALRNYLSLLDSVPTQTSLELTNFVVRFIQSVQTKGVNNCVEKLLLIRRCLQHPKLDRRDIVNVLLPEIVPVLHMHMNESIDEKAACATIMQKCVQFLDYSRPRTVIYGNSKTLTTLPLERKPVIPSNQLYDDFTLLMLKLFAILDEIRNTELSEVGAVMRIFGKNVHKNKNALHSNHKQNNTSGHHPSLMTHATNHYSNFSDDQLKIHRDLFLTIADLARNISMVHHRRSNKRSSKRSSKISSSNGGGKTSSNKWGIRNDRVDQCIQIIINSNEVQHESEHKSNGAAAAAQTTHGGGGGGGGGGANHLKSRISRVMSSGRLTGFDAAADIIDHVLKCCSNLLSSSLFPSSWVFMRMLEAEVAMRGLGWFGSTLQRNYLGSSFSRKVWQTWLGLGMSFLANEDFALEDMDMDRADIICKSFGDVRNIAIGKLRTAWNVLTPHRSSLADTMISAAVQASASEVEEIQEFAVDVYFQMMQSEFESSGHMLSVETHTIDQIDQLTARFSHKEKVINRYLDFFRKRVRQKLDELTTNPKNKLLQQKGHQFIDDVERLYGYLVKLKRLPTDAEHEDERTSATILLLNYLDGSGKNELYNRYIHHLAIMHQQLKNHCEAAVCFKKHADRLQWSDRQLKKEPLVGLQAAPEWKRHVALCELAQKQFMLFEAWEQAIKVCQELAVAYETHVFDLKALSSVLEKQAQVWKYIAQQDRVFHSCYLVKFRGNFSSELRTKQFIYRSGRGKNLESVRDFTDRIKKKWESAIVINSSEPVPAEYDDPSYDGQFIEITTLTPSSEEELKGNDFSWDSTKAPLRLKKYYRENETATFFYTYTKKMARKKGDNEFRNLWVTKVFVVAEESIPCMRRRVAVMNETVITYTPLQTAINNLKLKNNDLIKIIEKCETDPSHNVNDLSMNLNGVLDAAVMGGVAKYREAFFDGTYLAQNTSEMKIVGGFYDAFGNQLTIAKNGMNIYEKYAPENLHPHVSHLSKCYSKMRAELADFLKHAPTPT